MMERTEIRHVGVSLLMLLVIGAGLAQPAAGQVRNSYGASAGGIWHGSVGLSDFSSLGVTGGIFAELAIKRSFGLRVEATWIGLPHDLGPLETRAQSLTALNADADPIRLVGGTLFLVWFDQRSSWAQTYFVLGAGGYRATQDDETQVALAFGPGFGLTMGRGRPSVGVELNAQVAVFEEGTLLMVPVRMLLRF